MGAEGRFSSGGPKRPACAREGNIGAMGERILWHRGAGKALLSSMLAALAILSLPHTARAADEVPAWFTETFLDLSHDPARSISHTMNPALLACSRLPRTLK